MIHKKTPVRKAAPIHAMIERPVFLRKTILGAAIDATKLLKELEEFRVLKVQKEKAHKQLGRVMRELRGEQKRLENEHLPMLPEMQAIRREPKQPFTPQPETAAPEQKSTPQRKPQQHSEIDRLNTELRDIEERLKHL